MVPPPRRPSAQVLLRPPKPAHHRNLRKPVRPPLPLIRLPRHRPPSRAAVAQASSARWPAQLRKRPLPHARHPPLQCQDLTNPRSGVAVGSSIGHAIGGFFGGGSSAPAADAAPSEPVAQGADGQYAVNSNFQPPKVCETDVRNFRSCMDENRGDLTICGWYMDQLKACQATAQQYS